MRAGIYAMVLDFHLSSYLVSCFSLSSLKTISVRWSLFEETMADFKLLFPRCISCWTLSMPAFISGEAIRIDTNAFGFTLGCWWPERNKCIKNLHYVMLVLKVLYHRSTHSITTVHLIIIDLKNKAVRRVPFIAMQRWYRDNRNNISSIFTQLLNRLPEGRTNSKYPTLHLLTTLLLRLKADFQSSKDKTGCMYVYLPPVFSPMATTSCQL